ncbi:MAG TPA: HepT-like ribonuclease domain-containing protein [Bradyrhizobium sp.]
MKDRESGINWRRLADLGNWLRHAYHRTDAGLLWVMIQDDLEPLHALSALPRNSKFDLFERSSFSPGYCAAAVLFYSPACIRRRSQT